MAKRRLTDLYMVGRELAFDDGVGEPIVVYLRKLNPVENDSAIKNANIARSAVLAAKRDATSDIYLAVHSAVTELNEDGLIDFLVQDERANRRAAIEAEVADDEEWSKEDYLNGLQELWETKLKAEWVRDQTDAEANRVYLELKRYSDACDSILEDIGLDLRAELEDKPRAVLEEKVMDKLLGMQASITWLQEYRRSEVYFATRDIDDKKARYFEDRAEVDELPENVFETLSEAYRAMTVDPQEGKDSRATGDSSPSSEQPESPATVGASGLEELTL